MIANGSGIMDQRTQPEAASPLSSTDEKFHRSRHEYNASTSKSSSSSSSPRRTNTDDDDDDAATLSSPAYPSFFSRPHHHHNNSRHNSLSSRLCFSVSGGPARRRVVLGLASLVLMTLLFWGFGVHTMLLEEREKYLQGATYGVKQDGVAGEVDVSNKPSMDGTLSTTGGPSTANTESAGHSAADPVELSPVKVDGGNAETGSKSASGHATEHSNADGHDGDDVSQSIHMPTVTLDEHGHNRPASNDSDFCTTWPVDKTTGKYKPKSIPTSQRHKLTSYAPQGGWKKPPGLKVVAMVFYGRKRNVDILDCYLQQNLARNGGGGYLDEVVFMVKTANEDDVEWLRAHVRGVEGYVFQDLDMCTTENGYGCIWEYADEDDTLYLKIDDDIVSPFLSRFTRGFCLFASTLPKRQP